MDEIRFGAWIVCELIEDGGKRTYKEKRPLAKVVSSASKGYLNASLGQPPLQTSLVDLSALNVKGKVLAWALVELDASKLDTLLSEKSMERKILLEHYAYQALVHMKALKVEAFEGQQPVVHTGARNWPGSKVFDMNPTHVDHLLLQEVQGPGHEKLGERLADLGLSDFARTTTCLQLWEPVSLLVSCNKWVDLSLPAFYQWSATCSVLLQEETKEVVERARSTANLHQTETIGKPITSGVELLGPAGFNQLSDQILQWAGMLLDGKTFDRETEESRFEFAIETCRTQAALLESMVAGSSLEDTVHGGKSRWNLVYLLQTLWFAFSLKSDAALKQALLHSLKVLFPRTGHAFLEKAISEDSMPLPSRSILVQARFFLDLAFMKHMREQNALRFQNTEEIGSALHLLIDSSPQGGFNWLMIQCLWISEADLSKAAAAAKDLVQLARQLNASSAQGFLLQEDEVDTEVNLLKAVASCIHRHPCPPVGLGRGDLLHELHALYHALFLETGEPKLLSQMVSSVCAITSDRGVEAGYPQAPSYAFHDLFPYFAQQQSMHCDGDDWEAETVPEADPVDCQVHRLSLQNTLPIPGCLHIVHNATRHMLSAMPHFEQRARLGFSALVDFLHKNFTRQRFIATCLETSLEGKAYVPLFSSFPHTVVKWRFGTLAAVCKDLLPLEVPLRRFWSLDRLTFHQGSKPREAGPATADGAFGDNRLEGPNLNKSTEAVLSGAFWSWVHMICTLAEWIGHVENWFESCPCHSGPDAQERLRLFAKMPCPLKSFRAPELATQCFAPFLQELSCLSSAEVVLVHTLHCKDEDRAWICEDFEAGRQHLLFSFTMQTACWSHLPHRLVCIGHFNEATARAEAAECLRIWVNMSAEEKQQSHFWTKELLDAQTELGRQLRAFIQGTSLQDPGLAKLDKVAAKFRFIPLSEKPIEGRHAIIHKTLKKASNAGPVFLSMAERMPVLIEASKRDSGFIECLAKTSESLYHPLQASITMGISNHPDLIDKLADVIQKRLDFRFMIWGATHKHSKTVKKIVYHVDSTSQFMNLSDVPAMDGGSKRPEAKKVRSTTSQHAFSFEERAAFQKLLDVHEPGNVYTIDRSSSFELRSLFMIVQGHSHNQSDASAVAQPVQDRENEDAHLLFNFQSDGGLDSDLPQGHGQTDGGALSSNFPIAFRILSLRPSRLKLPQVDKDFDLAWTDIAVSILPVVEASSRRSAHETMLVGCCPVTPSVEAVSVMSKGGFATIRMWEKEKKLQCNFDPTIVSQKPLDCAENMVEVADALVQAGAFPNTLTGLLDSALADEHKQCLEHLSALGLVGKTMAGLWQLTPSGVNSFQLGFRLTKPRGLVDLELDVPLVDRSESALLLALRKADWQLFQWRKTKNQPYPEPYPFEFSLCKPPKKYFYVNAGRQSVGQSYLACLVGLSDAKLVDFFKQHGVHALKHLQSDQYYSKLLCGTLNALDNQDDFDFAYDGGVDFDLAGEPAKKNQRPNRKQGATPAAPFAPMAPQLKEPQANTPIAVDAGETPKQPQTSSSSNKRKAPEKESAQDLGGPEGSSEAAKAKGVHTGHARDFVLAESFRWGAVSFKFRKKPAGFQVDCPNRAHYIRHDWGSTTTCSKSLVFTAESKDMVIRRLKNWAVEGLECETREAHTKKSNDIATRPVKHLLTDTELEAKRPKKPLTSTGEQTVPKKKAKAKAAKAKLPRLRSLRSRRRKNQSQGNLPKGKPKSQLLPCRIKTLKLKLT